MNIAVIAANGRLGKIFVAIARSAGHSVRAGVRSGEAMSDDDGLTSLTCDATNLSDVQALIRGADAVVSCLGHVKGSKADVQTVATRTIIEAMVTTGITRYVDITGTGVRFPGDKISLVDRFLNLGVRVMDPARVQDGIDHQAVLLDSDREWTTIRVLKLQNIAAHPYSLTLNGPTKWVVGRQEAAQAMLSVIENGTFIQQAPIISRP